MTDNPEQPESPETDVAHPAYQLGQILALISAVRHLFLQLPEPIRNQIFSEIRASSVRMNTVLAGWVKKADQRDPRYRALSAGLSNTIQALKDKGAG